MIELTTHESIRAIREDEWDSLLRDDDPPFLSWAFLDVLEQTGCVGADRGWYPCHITLKRHGKLLAAAPAYVKENSEGEFVFDHSWAEFTATRLRIPYYPKLVLAVPFTPATGRRVLVRAREDEREVHQALAAGIVQLSDKLDVSGAHVLFPTSEQAVALEAEGLVHRHGIQYHWRNQGYATFEDFIERFGSKKRNQIRREIRGPSEQGLVLESLSGRDLTPALIDAVYDFYRSTVEKHFWGRQYLNRAFFLEVARRLPDATFVVLAREEGSGVPIAGAFNVLGKKALYGRYWGAREDRPFLHFNVCYYHGIKECIARGLSLFEPGAGGEHKVARGFEPSITHSIHHLADGRLDRVVRDFVGRERRAIQQHLTEYAKSPILKATAFVE